MSLPTRPLACKRWYHIQRWLHTMVLLLILHLQLRIDTDERLSLVQQVLQICTDNLDENKKSTWAIWAAILNLQAILIVIFSFVAIISPGFSMFLLLTIILIKLVSLGLAFSWNWTSKSSSTKANESLWWVATGLHRVGSLVLTTKKRYPMSLVLPVELLAR